MKQGEIWLIDFPDGAGHEFRKQRPAVIVESSAQIQKTNVYTIIPLTSNIDNCTDDDILVSPNNYNNLWKDSVLKVHHIQTFDSTRFIKKIGKVQAEVLEEILDYIREHFGI